jgi:two-component system, NtrC family, nitrogen regulation sensor histidine kinase NtrY
MGEPFELRQDLLYRINTVETMEEIQHPGLSFISEKNELNQIQLIISVNGKGINDNVIDRIFLQFYTEKFDNFGIGMSLSQQIMMLHNALLEVNSEPEKGTTFMMVF